MASAGELNPHEMLELHEIMRSEVTWAKKSRANLGMVADPDLRAFIQASLDLKKASLDKYQEFCEIQEANSMEL